jgi:hypothetical protein
VNYRLVAALGVVASTAFGQVAHAQSTGLIPFRAKIGAFFPQSSGKTVAGSTTINVEGDIALPELMAGKVFLSAGYAQGSDNGGKLRVIPVTLGRYFAPPNPLGGVTGNVYFGAGLGAYFVKADNGVTSDSSVKPGGFGVVGYQFPNPYFIEAKYHIVGKTNGINPSGFALMVGRHF